MTKKLWTLFSSVFYISAFTFGGGYVIIPLMQKRFVDELGWIEEEEMLDLVAIAQSTPGSVAVNASILVGFKVSGVFGAIVTIFGTILPPLLIISIISLFYEAFKTNMFVALFLKGMQAGVCAVIFNVVIRLGGNIIKTKDTLNLILLVLAFTAAVILDFNVVYIIGICALVGLVSGLYLSKEVK
jgi:chromate transporter